MVDSVRFGPAITTSHRAPVEIRPGVVASARHENATSPAQTLSLAAALAQKGPPFDAEKVATLKAAIASGQYKIDLGAVAGAMVRFGGKIG